MILDGLLRIEGWTPELEAACKTAGFQPVPDFTGRMCLPFEPQPKDLRTNLSAIAALEFLAAQGVAFARDYKQTFDPAYAIKYLRDEGLFEGDILTCCFDGEVWHVNHE